MKEEIVFASDFNQLRTEIHTLEGQMKPMQKMKKRILLIDRDPDTCEMLHIILTYAGYEFASANTMADGFALAKTDSFDLILLDFYFPDGTGLELTKFIRSFDGKIPIFFYTAESQEKHIQEALQSEVQGYLIKPVETDYILQT